MKKLFILTALIASSLIATKGYSQVFVGARIGARVGFAHVGIGIPVIAPAPFVIAAPAPVVYDEFPGYAYYNYPAWNGHFRDRIYYEHYQPFFIREHRFDRRFDHRGRW